jgi:hypothetical protein
MAITDIPEFVEVAPGDLIRAENWNNMQQQMRDSLRRHQHTRAPNAPVNDTAATDEADQIGTSEIADGAVTAAKLATGAISTAVIPDGAVTTSKLADHAVTTAKVADNAINTNQISPNAVTSTRIAFSTVAQSSIDLKPGDKQDLLVQNNNKGGGQTAAAILFFPLITVTQAAGAGATDVQADIVYQMLVGQTAPNVFLRLTNNGSATAHVIWKVVTFAS